MSHAGSGSGHCKRLGSRVLAIEIQEGDIQSLIVVEMVSTGLG